ncbi:ATP-grasp domain-containing protein [Tamlana sp. 2201CG12-4]|uniref:ATP-grasp domain-containing protein n=1 Tax=Tamlana sp. 2201CG12-4 TaxID=3112582 RepID=UPI002DB65776|nr:ATP-grasp domain-containing protein [Tamlana sp. 2201CG12-4]MEC3907602.1 ATP-grasp domain-containing protein [Tamlana sp. 2201CG12-4]
MNILLTSAGRRSYLVEYFKEAVQGKGYVIAANSIADTPAMRAADKSFVLPFVYEENYLDALLDICKKERVDFLFSLHDLEGPILSQNKLKIEALNVNVVVPNPEIINLCLDKFSTYKFLVKHNINTPKTWLKPSDIKTKHFPLIVKPRFGFGSINHLFVNGRTELNFAFQYLESRKNHKLLDYLGVNEEESATIIQEVIDSDEYGIEILNDYQGNYVAQFQKMKLGMRAGETDSAKIIKNVLLSELGVLISKTVKHIGMLDCDVFFKNKVPYVLEMNPRFGGQYPFSHMAGANVPEVLISNFKKQVRFPEVDTIFVKDITIVKYE